MPVYQGVIKPKRDFSGLFIERIAGSEDSARELLDRRLSEDFPKLYGYWVEDGRQIRRKKTPLNLTPGA